MLENFLSAAMKWFPEEMRNGGRAGGKEGKNSSKEKKGHFPLLAQGMFWAEPKFQDQEVGNTKDLENL